MNAVTIGMMALGVGSASGLRPFFAILVLGAVRYLDPQVVPELVRPAAHLIPETFASPWIMGCCAVMAIGEWGIDKLVGVNLPVELVGQVARPVIGAVIGHQLGAPEGTATAVAAAVAGGGSATAVSVGKGALLAGLTAILPEPVSQVLRSVAEDFGAGALLVAVVLAPIIAAVLGILAVITAIVLTVVFRRAYRRLRARWRRARPA